MCLQHLYGCWYDVNATTRIHDSLTFLGATWVGHELALYLELDQCSNSRTHQDFAPNQSSYGNPYIVKWNQTTRNEGQELKAGQNWNIQLLHRTENENKAGKHHLNGENDEEH